MFIGHHGPGFAIKAIRPAIPLWLLFMAVQLVDVAWAVLVLLGIDKVRIVPGITAPNPLDLYYMPYTHSLAAAVLWATLMLVVQCYVFFGPPPISPGAAAITALASYVAFAAVAQWLGRQREHAAVRLAVGAYWVLSHMFRKTRP